MPKMPLKFLIATALAAALTAFPMAAGSLDDGWRQRPFRVVLVPADGGTEDGTRADFQPLFNAVARMTGRRCELTVAQSYAAATEAMCTGAAEIGWFGAVSYLQTKSRGCAE